jgi:hypothetical protein
MEEAVGDGEAYDAFVYLRNSTLSADPGPSVLSLGMDGAGVQRFNLSPSPSKLIRAIPSPAHCIAHTLRQIHPSARTCAYVHHCAHVELPSHGRPYACSAARTTGNNRDRDVSYRRKPKPAMSPTPASLIPIEDAIVERVPLPPTTRDGLPCRPCAFVPVGSAVAAHSCTTLATGRNVRPLRMLHASHLVHCLRTAVMCALAYSESPAVVRAPLFPSLPGGSR